MKLSNACVLPRLCGVSARKYLLFPLALLALASCAAQSQPTGNTQPSLDSAIEMARAEMSAERNAIVTATMNLSDKEAAAFWPIYRKYEYERSLVDDGRAAVIKEYAEKYSSLTDADAKSMTEKMLDYDSREVALKKKYVKEFEKVVSATTVAKFFQLNHRIDLVMATKIEASLPSLARPEEAQGPSMDTQSPDTQNTTSPKVLPGVQEN